jgi:hypothetical protein
MFLPQRAHGSSRPFLDWSVRGRPRTVDRGERSTGFGSIAAPGAIRRQLLGYLTWRDTKAALLLFIRSGAPGDVMPKAIAGSAD